MQRKTPQQMAIDFVIKENRRLMDENSRLRAEMTEIINQLRELLEEST